MKRALGLWWTPLAVRSSCVAFSSPTLLRGIAMPIANDLYRVILRPAACRNIVSVGGSKTVDAWSTSRPCRARKLLLRLSSISRASTSSSQDMSTSNEPSVDKEVVSDGIESAACAAAKRRASSRYIPSDYRGVLGGPKGKWKARIVSKGGLRQLGTFGSELDAARAYNRAAQALHGSAAKLNLVPDEEITAGHKPEKNVLSAASAETLGEGESARGVVPDVQECAAASGPLALNETQRHDSVAPAFPAMYGTGEGKASTSSATAADSRVSDAGRDDNTAAARNSTSSLKGAGATAGTDDRIEVHRVDARSVSTVELANETAVDVHIDVGVGVDPGNRGSGITDMIAVDPVGTGSSVLPELDFRDLEEIPVSTGPSLWEDSASSRFIDENNSGGASASSFSFGQATNPFVRHDPSQQELAATNSNLKDGAGVGNVTAEEVKVTEVPSSMLLHGDEARALSPSPREVHDVKRSAAAVMIPGVKAIPDASSAGPAERARVYLESSPSEPAPTERQVVGAGADPPSTSRPPEAMDELGLESTAVGVAVLHPEGAASSDSEAVHGESDVPAMHGPVAVAGGDGSEEDVVDAWVSTSPSTAGIVGWERDEAGDGLYEEKLKGVVDVSTGLDRYWMEPLLRLTKPETRKVATQLSSANKLGYVSSRGGGVGRGSLLEFVLKQKEQHPTKVLLTRVGEFYETYGVDAVMMMQHAGLNKMGQEIRAGCPRKNVQQTLDGLTGAGLTVAIYEEVNDVDAQRGPSAKARIKERFLSQVVSPGSPNYLYEGCLRTDDISFRESKPYVGVMKDSSGYLLCQIYTDEREIAVSERMTEEAVRVALEEAGVAEPVFDQSTGLTFLPDHPEQLTGFPSAAFPGQVLARVARLLELAQSDLEHFRTVTRIPEGRPRPVYPSTALQIGLLRNPNVPDLVPCLLPAGYPAACHRFLRKWLLLPPPYRLADSAHQLCRRLASHEQAGLPPLHAVPVGKAKALLLDRQCNVPFFREIHQCVRGMLDMLGDAKGLDLGSNFEGRLGANANADLGGSGDKYSALLPHLLELVAYHSGVEAVEDHLRDRAKAIIRSIEDVVAPSNGSDDISFDPAGLVPDSFWRCNEASFRGSLSLEHEATRKAYDVLNQAVSRLCSAVKEDFPNAPQDLTFDFHNNGIYLTKLPPSAKTGSTSASSTSTVVKIKSKADADADADGGEGTAVFVHPHDRNGKLLSKRFTTKRVSEALSVYLTAVQETESTVKLELQALSDVLVQGNDLPVIAQAAHWSVICQSMEGHVRRSLSSVWSLPSLKSLDDPDMSMQVENLVPYWLPRGEAVPNSFDFRGLFLLTAPNMSGKSTLMRSVLACSLLANAGLFVPCTSAAVPRFDGFFLRTASYDVPAEDKSAFALEMDDVRVMLRDSSRRSLALVDELGKGTSARDGAALAGALLEEMDRVSITGIFATHLHELFDLPLKTSTLSHKRMGIDSEDSDNPKWTYTMEDGMCTNSLALQTAKKYNIPGRVIARAEALSVAFDDVCRGRRKTRTAISIPSSSSRRDANGHDERPRDEATNLGGGDGDGQAWWPSDGRGWGGNSPGGVRSMTDAAQVVSRITGRAEADIVSVDSGHGSPPILEGRSCLYVLRCAAFVGAPGWGAPSDDPAAAASLATSYDQRPSAAEGAEDGVGDSAKAKPLSGELLSESSRRGGGREAGGVWFYVGETDAIRERLKQHSKRWGGGTGSDAGAGGVCRLDAIVVGVDNRSEARRLETAVIRAMKEDGFYLVSDRDGSRTHFSSAGSVTRLTPPRPRLS